MPEGTRTVVDPGSEGARSTIWRVSYANGKEVSRERIGAGAVTPAKPKIVKVGTKKDAPAQDAGVLTGVLQFDEQTWNAYGGDAFAARPDQASREEQISVANKIKDDRGGYSAWPSCSGQLGLS